MNNNQLKYLKYLGESNKSNTNFYNSINEELNSTTVLNKKVYDINSEGNQNILNSIDQDNLVSKCNELLYRAFNNICYQNPIGTFPVGGGGNKEGAVKIRKWYLGIFKQIIEKILILDTGEKSYLTSLKEKGKKYNIKLSKKELYDKISINDKSILPEDLSSFINLSDINTLKQYGFEQYKTKYKELIASFPIPKEISREDKKGIDNNKRKKIIPTFLDSEDSASSLAFANIYADCMIYLYVNSIINKTSKSTSNIDGKENLKQDVSQVQKKKAINANRTVANDQFQKTSREQHLAILNRMLKN